MMAAQASFLPRIGSLLASAFPILVIAALLFSAVYIKPRVVPREVAPIPIHPRDAFYAADALPSGQIWMVGRGNKVIVTPGLGQPWKIIEPKPASNWQGVVAISDKEVVIAGNEGVMLRTQDGGASWQPVVTKDILTVHDAKFLRLKQDPDGQIWALAEFGNVLVSKDRGRSWKSLTPKADIGWNDIAFLPRGRVVIVGEFGKILSSNDGGQRWSETEIPNTSSLMSLAIRPSGVGVAVGLEGGLLLTQDGGQTWSAQKPFTRSHLFSVVQDGGRFNAVGDKGVIAQSTDGRNWTMVPGKPNDSAWRTDQIAVGDGLLMAGRNPLFLARDGVKFLTEVSR